MPRRSPAQTRLFHEKTLIYGDNLKILRNPYLFREESVDLIYLDPPFNSNKNYNLLFRATSGTPSVSQGNVFEDTWKWDEAASEAYHDIMENSPTSVRRTVESMRGILERTSVFAYLCMMAPRLVELRRVLRPTGSLYLHCDPGASHYLKLLMDAIFGADNFRNEIIWKRSHGHNSAGRFGRNHDVILYYAMSKASTWNRVFQAYDLTYTDKHYRHIDPKTGRRYKHENPTGAGISKGATGQPWRGIDPTAKGRHWARNPDELDRLDKEGLIHWPTKRGAWPYIKEFLDEKQGVPAQDIWADIDVINMMAQERVGYPTQKPTELLERIISASSNPGDIVLDPFCGCGTTIEAAEGLSRKWIGIDIAYDAIRIIRERLEKRLGLTPKEYEVWGEPESLEDAIQLAEEHKYQFQWWAVRRLGAKEIDYIKGADQRVDGRMLLRAERLGDRLPEAIISVKAGRKSGPQHVSELRGVIERENVEIGVLVTRGKPTPAMKKEASAAGEYSDGKRWYPRIQLITAEDIIAGKGIEYPATLPEVDEAKKVKSAAMGKAKKSESKEYEAFENLTRTLVSVPKKEIDDKTRELKDRKPKKPSL